MAQLLQFSYKTGEFQDFETKQIKSTLDESQRDQNLLQNALQTVTLYCQHNIFSLMYQFWYHIVDTHTHTHNFNAMLSAAPADFMTTCRNIKLYPSKLTLEKKY
jgi:hypothetical protein